MALSAGERLVSTLCPRPSEGKAQENGTVWSDEKKKAHLEREKEREAGGVGAKTIKPIKTIVSCISRGPWRVVNLFLLRTAGRYQIDFKWFNRL